ncbi:hypothetical protein L345_03423, partial [Ophiophagus hannah]
MVSRSETDLLSIRTEFKRRYGISLYSFIKKEAPLPGLPSPPLAYLVHLPLVHRGAPRRLLAQRVAQVEFGVTEAAVPVHVVQALPGDLVFVQETLVGHQQVEVALVPSGKERRSKRGGGK